MAETKDCYMNPLALEREKLMGKSCTLEKKKKKQKLNKVSFGCNAWKQEPLHILI